MKLNGFLGRRDLLKLSLISSAAMAAEWQWQTPPVQAATTGLNSESSLISGDTALQRLLEGNQRFIAQKPQAPQPTVQRLRETAQGQHPFAIVLGCADSRVPPEILFDAGIGDVFDIRVAGNIVTPEVLGSLEYAALELGTQLIVVLGHERCGAVTAAVRGKPLPGNIGSLVTAIQPALGKVKRTAQDVVETAVVANAQHQAYEIKRQSSLLANLVAQRQLKIVAARYDLDDGKVTIV